jgi:hypothetical protein
MMKTSRPSPVIGPLSVSLLLGALALGGCNRYKDVGVETVRSNKNDISGCVSEMFTRNPGAKGEMSMKFEITPDGKVNRFAIGRDDVKDPAFSDCLKQRAVQWQFPPPPSGKMELFEYPFKVKN